MRITTTTVCAELASLDGTRSNFSKQLQKSVLNTAETLRYCFVAKLMWTYFDVIGLAPLYFYFAIFSIKNISIELNLILGLGALNNSRVDISRLAATAKGIYSWAFG